MSLPRIDKEKFEQDGFLLIKNVLESEEVANLRRAAYRTIEQDEEKGTFFIHGKAKNHLGCLTGIPDFRRLILNPKVVHIAQELLGNRPCFFGDTVFEIGAGGRGFHKDGPKRIEPNHPIVRIAFYLQDHKAHSGGLKVRVGSHKTEKMGVGKPIFVPSEPGDAVVFSVRLTHAGNGVRLKFMPETPIHHRLEKRIPDFLKISEDQDRVSIFLTYGLKGPTLDSYLEFMRNHKVYQKRINLTSYHEEVVQEIESKLDFIDMTKEVPAT